MTMSPVKEQQAIEKLSQDGLSLKRFQENQTPKRCLTTVQQNSRTLQLENKQTK